MHVATQNKVVAIYYNMHANCKKWHTQVHITPYNYYMGIIRPLYTGPYATGRMAINLHDFITKQVADYS